MPRKFFRKHLPDHESIRQQRWLRGLAPLLRHHNLWHLHRRSVAGGVAVGLFSGLIPGPFQMIGAAILAMLFRVNLPVAMLTTLYTNPLTIVPLYVAAYEIGRVFTPDEPHPISDFSFDWGTAPWQDFIPAFAHWMGSMGQAFLVGLPLLAIGLALVGYFAVRAAWRIYAIIEWRRRARRCPTHSD